MLWEDRWIKRWERKRKKESGAEKSFINFGGASFHSLGAVSPQIRNWSQREKKQGKKKKEKKTGSRSVRGMKRGGMLCSIAQNMSIMSEGIISKRMGADWKISHSVSIGKMDGDKELKMEYKIANS